MRMRLVLLQHCGAFVAWFYYETTSKLDYLPSCIAGGNRTREGFVHVHSVLSLL